MSKNAQHFGQPGRLVGLPAIALGRHVGGVGFQYEVFQRHLPREADRADRVLPGERTAERDGESAADEFPRHFRRAGKGVHDAPYVVSLFFVQYRQRPPKNLAAVDQHRQSPGNSQAELFAETVLLYLERDRIVRVKPDLADGDGMGSQFCQATQGVFVHEACVHGVDAEGGQDAIMRCGKRCNPLPAVGMHPWDHEAGHTGEPGCLDHLIQGRDKRLQVQVAMGVDQSANSFRLQICLIWIHWSFIPPEMPMQHDHILQLSIIVPILDEAAILPALFATLAAQQGVRFELILSDGGSCDDTRRYAAQLADASRFTVKILDAPRGRGCQMNAGAAAAEADILLFLHADSVFDTRDALERALSALKTGWAESASDAVAGRFGLRFRRHGAEPSLAYFFYEAKTRLKRNDCIRGDQGFMISRLFFQHLGGFDEQRPYLEDIRLADAIASQGSWTLLPAEVSTSARRFETEGLLERQVVNAIIVNSLVAGWDEFFSTLPGLYRFNADTGRLSLFPVLDGIRVLLASQPESWRRAFWKSTGRFVAANAWQLFFWLDVRRAFSRGNGPGEVEPRFLDLYQRRSAWLFQTLPAAGAAAACVKLWFRFVLMKYRPSKRHGDLHAE